MAQKEEGLDLAVAANGDGDDERKKYIVFLLYKIQWDSKHVQLMTKISPGNLKITMNLPF